MSTIAILLSAAALFAQTLDAPYDAAVAQAMAGREGTAVVLGVENGEILGAYRMDVAARRVATPGSAVKPFTLMALVEAGLLGPDTAVYCPIGVRFAGRNLDCSHQRFPEPVDAVTALAHSCNHFFSHLAEGFRAGALYRVFSRLGFNALSGRWPSEVAGTLLPPASTEALKLMSLGEDSVAVTPLALAEAYRGLALRLRDPVDAAPELELVRDGLRAAVRVGTARRAASDSIQIAGKTGTSGGHAWFAGMAPAARPEIVTVVFLEQGTGGADAAPIAGQILEAYRSARDSR